MADKDQGVTRIKGSESLILSYLTSLTSSRLCINESDPLITC